jgi:hypothetical protein
MFRQADADGGAWCCEVAGSETGALLDPENFSRIFAKLYNRAGLGH